MAARTVNGANQDTITLTSTSTVVQLIPPGYRLAGWVMQSRGGSSVNALIFMNNADGTIPNAAPTQAWELRPGNSVNDQLTVSSSGQDVTLNLGWSAVLQSAGSATIDLIYR